VASSILSGGVDLDSLLMPIGAFTPISNVNIKSNGGVDIAQRYAGASHGTPYGTTNIKSGGVDIGTLFARIAAGPTTYTLVAASFSPGPGDFEYGFASFGGSVSPTTYAGYTITRLFTLVDTVLSTYGDDFTLSAASDPGSSLFTSITVGAQVRTSASATYSYSGGVANWGWSGTPYTNGLFQSATTYSVVIA